MTYISEVEYKQRKITKNASKSEKEALVQACRHFNNMCDYRHAVRIAKNLGMSDLARVLEWNHYCSRSSCLGITRTVDNFKEFDALCKFMDEHTCSYFYE